MAVSQELMQESVDRERRGLQKQKFGYFLLSLVSLSLIHISESPCRSKCMLPEGPGGDV